MNDLLKGARPVNVKVETHIRDILIAAGSSKLPIHLVYMALVQTLGVLISNWYQASGPEEFAKWRPGLVSCLDEVRQIALSANPEITYSLFKERDEETMKARIDAMLAAVKGAIDSAKANG